MQKKQNDKLSQYDIKNKTIEQIMMDYKPLVSQIARRYFLYCGEIDDLMQEGMIGLYKAIRDYDPNKQTSFKTFANLCITRQIHSAIRTANSKKNIMFLDILDNSENNFDVATNVENPENKLIENQSYEKFWSEINSKLSAKELQILNEYLEGYSYEQIAQKLQIERKSVDNALVRIRAKLAYLLKENEGNR